MSGPETARASPRRILVTEVQETAEQLEQLGVFWRSASILGMIIEGSAHRKRLAAATLAEAPGLDGLVLASSLLAAWHEAAGAVPLRFFSNALFLSGGPSLGSRGWPLVSSFVCLHAWLVLGAESLLSALWSD